MPGGAEGVFDATVVVGTREVEGTGVPDVTGALVVEGGANVVMGDVAVEVGGAYVVTGAVVVVCNRHAISSRHAIGATAGFICFLVMQSSIAQCKVAHTKMQDGTRQDHMSHHTTTRLVEKGESLYSGVRCSLCGDMLLRALKTTANTGKVSSIRTC